ncbi:MAG: T9SS type A sorting domain-containing protein [Bacteroidia bacterium]|nr:T9SS type A sorting domain-containing protein [Bacteroidia bacterium]
MKQIQLLFLTLILSAQIKSQTGAALHFDGSGDYVACGNFLPATYTKEAWIKVSNHTGSSNVISGGGDGQHALWVPSGLLSAGHNGAWTQVQDPTPLLTNTWYHIAVTYDAATTTLKLYKNGVVVSTNTSVPAYGGGNAVRIGAYTAGGNLFNGTIDEARVWNVVRTPCEISEYMNCEIPTTATGLLANYHFNQGINAGINTTETSLIDASGNTNNGTLTAFALTTGTTSNWVAPGGVVSGYSTTGVSQLTVSVTNSVICNGESTTLTASGADTYTWTGGVTNGVAFNPTVTTTYTVTGTNASGCLTLPVIQVVTVNTPTITVNDGVICSGNSYTITPAGASTYTISGGNFVVSPTVTTTYTITGTNAQGCVSLNTTVCEVYVNDLPIVTASSTNSVICNGESTTLIGGGADTYIWTNGVTNNTVFTPTTTLTYTVTGTDLNNCENTATQVITVNELPIVTASASNSVICNGAPTTLNGGGASTYTWTGGVTDGVSFTPTTTITYTVTGTSVAGCNSTNTATQMVTVNDLPTVTASASNSVICNGASTTLNGGGASTYTWTGGVTNNTAFTPTTTLTYTVTGSDANGCENTATQMVTVNDLPTVTASVTSSVICNGASTTLNGGGASTYTWTGGVTNNTAFTPTTTLTYAVTGTDANGCENTATQMVTVNDLPTVTASASNSVICNGASTTLNGGGADTYTWTNGVTNNTAFTPTTTLTYTVTGTDANGCENTATQMVTVNDLPTVTASASNSVICNGASTTLNGGGASTYTWTGGVTNNTAFTPTTTLTYTVTGTDANGCENTTTQMVTVNDLPTISVTSASICAGSTGTVSASGADTYTWSTGSNSDVITDNPAATAVYTVSGTSVEGCIGTAVTATITVGSAPSIVVNSETICAGSSVTLTANGVTTYTWSTGENSNTIIVSPTTNTVYVVSGDLTGCSVNASNTSTVTVNALPTLTVNSGAICSGASFTIVPDGALTYTYSGGSDVVLPTADNSYTVTGTDGNGCENTAVSTVTVNALPVIMATSTTTLLCTGETVTLSVTGATSYTWSTTENTADIEVTPTSQTTYSVEGTDANGCSNTTTITQDVSLCTGIASIATTDASIYVYPNPNNGLFTIELINTSKVTVTNALGQVIISETFEAGKHQIDINNETTGVYFVKVVENNKQQMIKVIKQ